MKKRTPSLFSLMLVLIVMATACKQQKKETTEEVVETEVATPVEAITLERLEDSPAYADAELILGAPNTGNNIKSGEVNFDFTVNNYELGVQTDSPNTELLANSAKGQHIHFILNNQPYSAHYEASFKKEIPDGVHHLVAFLSRSYHESVKNKNAVVVKKLEVGKNAQDTLELDMEAPTLIYSRPKGTYSGKDTENILLDFFVLNTTLSANGNKVKATINGEEFLIDQWAPMVINGLPLGETTITLELIDADGNMIPGPFNKVTRTVNLKE